MGGGESKESKNVFKVKKIYSENEKRAKLGLGPAPKNPMVMGKPKVKGPNYYGFMKDRAEETVLMSPVVFSFDSPDAINENIFEKNLLGNIEKEKNYGWLPVEVIHELLLMMEPIDLLNCMLSCKICYRISSTNFFWKSYYFHFYNEKAESIKVKDEHFNWKKQFFKRYSGIVTDTSMRKKWNPEKMSEEEIKNWKPIAALTAPMFMFGGGGGNQTQSFTFRILGKKGVGKRSLCHQLVETKFDPNCENMGNDYHFRTSPAKVTTPTIPSAGPVHPIVFHRNGFGGINFTSNCKIIVANDEDLKDVSLLSRESVSGYFLCFSVDDHSSFTSLRRYEKTLKKIEGHKDGSTEAPKGQHRYNVMLVGLKSDVNLKERKVKREEVRLFVKKNNFKGYVECSSKNNCNVFLPFGLILTKAVTAKTEEAPLIMTEMPAMPQREIQFNPMLLTQKII